MARVAQPRMRGPWARRGPVRWPAVVVVVLAVAVLGLGLERIAHPPIEVVAAVPGEASAPSRQAPPAAAAETAVTAAPDGSVAATGAAGAASPPRAGDAPAALASAAPAPGKPVSGEPPAGHGEALEHAVAVHFRRGVALLHAGRPEYAAVAFHEVLRLAPRLPEAHVNMGYALLAQERPQAARDFFVAAIELRARQANAYYGLAVASEALGDIPAALGAMRSYVHLAPPEDPFVRRGRAALWEWQAARDGASGQVAASGDAEPAPDVAGPGDGSRRAGDGRH